RLFTRLIAPPSPARGGRSLRGALPSWEGARQVLGTVRAGWGSNLVSTNRDRQSATVLLEALGLEVEIDDMVCAPDGFPCKPDPRSEEHTSELQSRFDLVCRRLLEKIKE